MELVRRPHNANAWKQLLNSTHQRDLSCTSSSPKAFEKSQMSQSLKDTEAKEIHTVGVALIPNLYLEPVHMSFKIVHCILEEPDLHVKARGLEQTNKTVSAG